MAEHGEASVGVRRHIAGTPVLVAGSMLCASLSAALTPTAQDRHVFASHDFEPYSLSDSETVSAPDFAPFSATVDGNVFPMPLATQISSIEPERLLVSGHTLANPSSRPDGSHEISSESVYSVDFTVDAPRSFMLTGWLDLGMGVDDGGCASSIGRITLTGPGGVVAEVDGHLPPPPGFPTTCIGGCALFLPLSASGRLDPGSYTLVARVDTDAIGFDLGPQPSCINSVNAAYEADLALAPAQVPALPLPLAPPLLVALSGVARRALAARPPRNLS